MTVNSVIFVFYLIFAVLVIAYVGVNIFHLIRFRLPLKGDLSLALMLAYLFIVAAILVSSIVLGLIALNV